MEIMHTGNQLVTTQDLIPTQNSLNSIRKQLIIKPILLCASSRNFFLQSQKKDQNIILFWSLTYKFQANSFALAQGS